MDRQHEIGGYFELERFCGEHYHVDAIALNSGRGCLSYEVELRGIRSMWVPDFICACVPELLQREGVEVKTYNIGGDFLPVYDFQIGSNEWLMLVDYYGQLDLVDIEQARVFSSSRLIVDETHGFFRKPWSAVDTIYSCRKWFGVADGAYLATGDGERILRHVPRDESYARYGFVLGRFERPAGDFFAESSANNAFFDREPVKLMSFLTDNLLRAIDYRTLRDRRDMNWDFLDEALKGMNSLVLRKPEGAFMYPFMIENAQELRKQLIAAGIFVPLLWPNVFEERKIGSDAWKLSADILPLPLDQRYGEDEMEYIVETLVKSQG